MPRMSVTKIARALDLHKSTVSRQARAWDLVGRDGLIDLDEYRARRGTDLDPALQPLPPAQGRGDHAGDDAGLQVVRARKMTADAERAELELRHRRGELVDRAIVVATLGPWIRELRDELLGIPREAILDPVLASDCEDRISSALLQFSERLAAMAISPQPPA